MQLINFGELSVDLQIECTFFMICVQHECSGQDMPCSHWDLLHWMGDIRNHKPETRNGIEPYNVSAGHI